MNASPLPEEQEYLKTIVGKEGYHYNKGDNALFFKYLNDVICPELIEAIVFARENMAKNRDLTNIRVFRQLENLIEKYNDGEIVIHEWIDWEMLGRPFEHLFRFFIHTSKKQYQEIRNSCWERAMVCYLKALQGVRAVHMYDLCPAEASHLKEKFEKEINTITSRLNLEEVREYQRRTEELIPLKEDEV